MDTDSFNDFYYTKMKEAEKLCEKMICCSAGLPICLLPMPDVIADNPGARAMLGIPKDHYMKLIVASDIRKLNITEEVKKKAIEKFID